MTTLDPRTPTITTEADTIIVRIPIGGPLTTAPDELIASTSWGLEAQATRLAIKSGALPVAKIGRKVYTKRSALLAYFDQLAAEQASEPTRKPNVPEDGKGLLLRLAGRGAR